MFMRVHLSNSIFLQYWYFSNAFFTNTIVRLMFYLYVLETNIEYDNTKIQLWLHIECLFQKHTNKTLSVSIREISVRKVPILHEIRKIFTLRQSYLNWVNVFVFSIKYMIAVFLLSIWIFLKTNGKINLNFQIYYLARSVVASADSSMGK